MVPSTALTGLFCIDKPKGPSSFAVVNRIKRTLATPKIGHCGTLDPAATGLLVIAVGSATRCIPYLPLEPKTYEFGIKFCTQTDTLDTEGSIVATSQVVPSRDKILELLPSFTGKLEQVPPNYSAVKLQGKRAYTKARNGEDFKIAPRIVTIDRLILTDFDEIDKCAKLSVVCSSGTYVRSLARDIALAAGSVGHASFIHRIGIGKFSIEQAVEPDAPDLRSHLIPLDIAFDQLPIFLATPSQVTAIIQGKDMSAIPDVSANEPLFLAIDEQKNVIALLERQSNGTLHPLRVLARS